MISLKTRIKAVGYVSKGSNEEKHKEIMKGFDKICKINNWQLVKIYEENNTSIFQPKKELNRLIKEVSDTNSKIEITISYAFGKYLVNRKPS